MAKKKKPIETEPAKIPDYPPGIGAAQPLVVGPTDNWWTLTRKIGRSNPWELIQYNFGTIKADEVNWCMRWILGCTLTTKDGLNYRFGGRLDGEPIKIYVPGLDWVPPQPNPPGTNLPDRPAEDAADRVANMMVRMVLMDPRLGFINFGISGYWINKVLFDTVRERISAGGIAVYSWNKNSKAEYDSGINALFVPAVPNEYTPALIVHECVHAGLDILKAKKIRVMDSEALAYVAQCIYFMKNKSSNPQIPSLGSEETAMANALKIAWQIAWRLVNGEPAHEIDFNPLRNQLLMTTNYGHGWDHAGYDGVAW